MRYIGYEELNKGRNYPRLADCLAPTAHPRKTEIVRFLKENGTIELAQSSRSKDIFTGEVIPEEVLVMRAGDFYWSNELAWYVERYNLRLPQAFEEFILKCICKEVLPVTREQANAIGKDAI
ncbi:MAG: hypothetical protein IKM60_00415 [Clostridia bacterium]|nr:hypothetical protein [Clostridia bacterium]